MTDRNVIADAIFNCKKMLEDRGLTIVGIFLYGSQNYNLDYEDSDIDLKAIVVPTINDIVFNNKPISTSIEIPEGLEVKSISNTEIELSGIDKCAIGQFAAEIRSLRKPEPYKGKGIRYKGEVIRRKEGKKASK